MAVQSCSAADKLVLKDVIGAYLEHSGHLLSNGHRRGAQSPLTLELTKAVIGLTGEYEVRYKLQLEQLARDWQISKENPDASFTEVLAAIFRDGCNWGRFVTIFVFISLFLRKCQQQRLSVQPEQVATWAADYMAADVMPWVKANGGWTGLLRFYEDGDIKEQTLDDGKSLMRVLTVAGASLALLGITSFLVNRA